MQANGKWVAKIGLYGKKYHLGTFDTYDHACKAREEAAFATSGILRI